MRCDRDGLTVVCSISTELAWYRDGRQYACVVHARIHAPPALHAHLWSTAVSLNTYFISCKYLDLHTRVYHRARIIYL